MALAHIFACVLLIVMASLRVSSWRKWERAAVAAEKAAAAAGGSTTKAVRGPPPPSPPPRSPSSPPSFFKRNRLFSVLLQRPGELKGFWPKLGEIAICTARQLLLLFPVTRAEFLEMRAAWMAAHELTPAAPTSSSSSLELVEEAGAARATAAAAGTGEGSERAVGIGSGDPRRGVGDFVTVGVNSYGGVEGKKTAAGGSPLVVSSTLPPISFADYVMKSFDDDVAGIVGLVSFIFWPFFFFF